MVINRRRLATLPLPLPLHRGAPASHPSPLQTSASATRIDSTPTAPAAQDRAQAHPRTGGSGSCTCRRTCGSGRCPAASCVAIRGSVVGWGMLVVGGTCKCVLSTGRRSSPAGSCHLPFVFYSPFSPKKLVALTAKKQPGAVGKVRAEGDASPRGMQRESSETPNRERGRYRWVGGWGEEDSLYSGGAVLSLVRRHAAANVARRPGGCCCEPTMSHFGARQTPAVTSHFPNPPPPTKQTT